MLIAACVAAAALSCRTQELTGPAGVRPPIFFSQGSPDVPVQGCAKWKITLTGGSGITVTPVSISSCGPIKPVLEATTTYDPVAKIITLTVADTNTWAREIVAPTRVYAWNDSITITTPTGLVNGTGGTYLRLTGMDSTIGSTATTFKNARLWKYDTLLAATGQPQTLWPATASRTHTITIQVVSGSPTVFNLLLRVQAQNAHVVPATAPNGQPAWLADDSALLKAGTWGRGTFSKYAIELYFKAGTSQTAKQALVDSIRGQVIGGSTIAQVYLIQIPADPTGALMDATINSLQANAQVKSAFPYSANDVVPEYRKPNDGAGWTRGSWQISRDSTRGNRWAYEILNAPLAWGCDTGSASAKIAVVDGEFYDIPDLRANVTKAVGRGIAKNMSDISVAHGTRVASLVGAVGNNTQQMSGVLWKADLRLYDWMGGSTNSTAAAHGTQLNIKTAIIQAGIDGADIINLSAGLYWGAIIQGGRMPGTGASNVVKQDSQAVRKAARVIYDALDILNNTYNQHPLIVIAAGNNQIDAVWSGYPAIKEPKYIADGEYTGQILVVGGSNRKNNFWVWPSVVGSTFGNLVDIVAPAESVWSEDTLDANPTPLSGTSFAAPLVSGTAGLLKSHDPRLKAWDLKSKILWGSSDSGPDSLNSLSVFDASNRGYWIADAYGALRQEAKNYQFNAPICGNRVWQDGYSGSIIIERGAGDSVEWYGPPPDTMQVLSRVGHGGNDIELAYSFTVPWGPIPTNTLHYDNIAHTWTDVASVDSARVFPPPPNFADQPMISLYTHERDTLIAYVQINFEWWEQFEVNAGGSWTKIPWYHLPLLTRLMSISPMGDKVVMAIDGSPWYIAEQDIVPSPAPPNALLLLSPGYEPYQALVSEDGDEIAVYDRWDQTNNLCEIQYISIYFGTPNGPDYNVGPCLFGAAVSPDRVAATGGEGIAGPLQPGQPHKIPRSTPHPSAQSVGGGAGAIAEAPPQPVRGRLSSKRRYLLAHSRLVGSVSAR